MILGNDRQAVIENIRCCATQGRFHDKVELHDPVLTLGQEREITDNFMENRNRIPFRLKTGVAMAATELATLCLNRNTQINGLHKIPKDLGGVIITSNHFSPTENTIIRHLTNRMGQKLSVISQTSNFAMDGTIGFLMNYANTVPISTDPRYLARDFLSVMKEKLVVRKEAVLLYPEQEMWFQYRKPRPPKNGAYFFAAKLNVPILSCFVEMVEQPKSETAEFQKLHYVLHVLDVLYPDPERPCRENTEMLSAQDYALKKACYEKVYGKPLTYDFECSDIAGWKGTV